MTLPFSELPLWGHGLLIAASIAALAGGANWLVDGATRLAARLNISPLVVGLTVVAFGTSAPEFAVTLIGAFQGQGDIAVGNVVGSNIFNLGFILGGCALLGPMPASRVLVRRDGLLLAAASLLVLLLIGHDFELARHEGLLLVLILVGYLVVVARSESRRVHLEEEEPPVDPDSAAWLPLLGGLTLIVLGAQVLVGSASAVAQGLGVHEWTIAVTVIAAGTSMPELATSLAAVLKRQHAMGIGSLVGSDLFNILGVLGVAGLLHPVTVDAAARSSLAAMLGMVLLVLVFLRTGWRLSRLEGLALISVASLRWWLDLSTPGLGS